MIEIIDVGIGNVKTLENMLQNIGLECVLVREPSKKYHGNIIILPGVGSFDNAILKLKSNGWVDYLQNSSIEEQIKVIGICLGMQLLGDSSEEGESTGLSLIKGNTRTIFLPPSERKELRIPHVGWNYVDIRPKTSNEAFHVERQKYYFNHSFAFHPENEKSIIGETSYGITFPSIVKHENVYGLQFHPERSLMAGKNILLELIGSLSES
jgi:glutamine amidotransferase